MFGHGRSTLRYLKEQDADCPGCGYNLRGLRRQQCPECGRAFTWQDMTAAEVRISLRTAAVDLVGLCFTVGVNVVLTGIVAAAVLVYGKSSWFTDPRFNLGGRSKLSFSGVLLIVLTVSFAAWGWAWERSSIASWRVQNALAVWCWLLTVFHAVGAATVLW